MDENLDESEKNKQIDLAMVAMIVWIIVQIMALFDTIMSMATQQAAKPIIYLYPEQEEIVTVKFRKRRKFDMHISNI